MKSLTMTAAAMFLAVILTRAEIPQGLDVMSASGEGEKPSSAYAPPFISNGSIATSIDNLGEQKQISHRGIIPDVAWIGRRYSLPERDLFPFGHYSTEIKIDGKPLGAPKNWTQTLYAARGYTETLVEYEGAFVRTIVFAYKNADILAVKKSVEFKKTTTAKAEISFKYLMTEKNTPEAPSRMLVSAVCEQNRARFDFTAYGYKIYKGEVSVLADKPANVSATANTATLSREISAENGRAEAAFFVCFADDFLDKNVKNRIDGQKSICELGFDKVFSDHKAAWESLKTQSYVNIPDERMMKVYNASLYFLRAIKTRWSLPISIYTHSQHWNAAYFTWDEMFMSLGLGAAGEFELARLAPDYRTKILPVALFKMKHPTGDFGAFYEFSTREDGTMAMPHPLGFWSWHTFQMAAIASECYSYYLYTNDKKYLEKVYPVIKNCAQYYYMFSICKNEKGETVVSKTLDLERLGPACPNPFMTSCGIIYNFEIAAKAAEILGVDGEAAKNYRQAASELKKSLPDDGKKYVPRPDRDDKSIACIGGLFPFPVFDEKNPLQKAAAYDFAENIYEVGNMYPLGKSVCTWYFTWAASALIRLGDRTIPCEWLEKTAQNTGLFCEPWEINEEKIKMRPWFSTAAGNYLHSVCAMLLSSRENGDVLFAPSVPDKWKDFSFNLPCYGGNFVSAKVQNGKLAKLEFTPSSSDSDANRTIVIPKRYVGASENISGWCSDGENWRIKVSGKFVLGK